MTAAYALTLYLGIGGLAVGSFLALVADRLPRGEPIVATRSHCAYCGKVLTWWELVPVLSYLGLRGRCSRCRARIPLRLPLVEVGTGLLFLLVGLRYGLSPATAVSLAYVSLLIVISLIDLQEKLILNVLVYPGVALALAAAPLAPWAPPGALEAWGSALLGGGVGALLLLGVYLASRGGMGAGDVKMAGLVGFMAGFPLVLVSLFVGVVAGGLVGLALLLLRLKGRKDAIPFGPFLALGATAGLLYGPAILDWYLGLLGF